jgi:hypothetical protein
MTEKRALYFRKGPAGGEIERPFWVTGKTESQIERIERGMLMNIGDGWYACDTSCDEPDEAQRVFDILEAKV